MDSKLIQTADGSHTIYVEAIDETYHSTHGAIQESMHVFIDSALRVTQLTTIRILEVGFGTGLNALLTKKEADVSSKTIYYTTLEKYPVPIDLVQGLNYEQCINNGLEQGFFPKMHEALWNVPVKLSANFELHKIDCDFTEFRSDVDQFDLIYFDAFSPDKQPEMWTLDQFRKIYECCAPGAIFVTYCAKGVVRRALQELGFKVERLPGPPGKREILRAIK